MATATINFPIGAAQPADGSASNAAPAIQSWVGTQTPKGSGLRAAFDPSTDEHLFWQFIMPQDYASGGTLRLLVAFNSTTAANAIFAGRLSAITAADADTYLEHAFSTAATVTLAVNATEARRVVSGTITLNMDSAAAGDLVQLLLFRDADNASDTCAVDAELLSVDFEYTTS